MTNKPIPAATALSDVEEQWQPGDCPMCAPGTCPGGAHRNALHGDGIETPEQYAALPDVATDEQFVKQKYPESFAVMSNGWLWSVYPDNASGCINTDNDSSETELAAWADAAANIRSGPNSDDEEDIGYIQDVRAGVRR